MSRHRTRPGIHAAVVAVGSIACLCAHADFSADVTDALSRVATGRDPGADMRLVELLAQQRQPAPWRDAFRQYFHANPYTPAIHEAYARIAAVSPGAQAHIAGVSALCAAEGAAAALQTLAGPPMDNAQPLRDALYWLQTLAPQLHAAAFEEVLQSFETALDKPAELTPWFTQGQPRQTALAIQAALTLAEYTTRKPAQRDRLLTILRLPETTQTFWRRHGIFLFDRQGLSPAHVRSLDSIAASIPLQLHRIAALLVPEFLGFNAQSAGLASTGAILDIAPYPMTVMSNPSEFVPQVGQPAAPEFTLAAAQAFFRAIQRYQFAQRPGLVIRRNRILQMAGVHREPYLRRFIPPSAYFENPDQFLTASAYLYFLDSARTFDTANELFEINQNEAMDTVLLLADVFSGGGANTVLLRTSPAGLMSSQSTPVGRTRVTRLAPLGPSRFGIAAEPPVNLLYLTAVRIRGYWWRFDLGTSGAVTRRMRTP